MQTWIAHLRVRISSINQLTRFALLTRTVVSFMEYILLALITHSEKFKLAVAAETMVR